MQNFIKIPVGAKHSPSWAKGVELERVFFQDSTDLCTEIEKEATDAAEGATESLTTPVNKICKETYKSNQNVPEENILERVTLIKGQINDILAIKVNT